MPKYRVSVEVNKPIEEAWEVLMDESKMGEWLEGYKGMELLEGEPLTVGSKHKMIFEEDGQELTFTETVTAISPPNGVLVRLRPRHDEQQHSNDAGERWACVDAHHEPHEIHGERVFHRPLHAPDDASDEGQAAQEFCPLEGVDRGELIP